MKITIEYYENKYIVEMPDNVEVSDFMYNVQGLSFIIYGEQALHHFDIK